MSHPDPELLADLALGEALPADIAAHVAGCGTCTAELDGLRAALAVARSPRVEMVAAPAGLWERVTATIDASEGAGSAPVAWAAPAPDELRALAPEPEPGTESRPAEPVVDEVAARRAKAARRRVGIGWVVGAAAAGLVFGAVGTRVVGGEESAPSPVVVASTPLDTLDTSTELGYASVVDRDGGIDLDVHIEPLASEDGYLEVWLINRDLERMVSIGVLTPEQSDQSFTISPDLIEQGYVIVDISREGYDDQPQHSGDSVVRGTLPA